MGQQEIELILIRQWASYLTLPVFLADREGNLLFYNEPAEVILGRRYDEAGPMRVSELVDLFEATTEDCSPIPRSELPISSALREHRPMHQRLRMKALDGAWHTIEITAFPIEGQNERHLGVVGLFREARPA